MTNQPSEKLSWNCFNAAAGSKHLYRISTDALGGYWWRYGRNIGIYGSAPSIEECKKECQEHHEKELNK